MDEPDSIHHPACGCDKAITSTDDEERAMLARFHGTAVKGEREKSSLPTEVFAEEPDL